MRYEKIIGIDPDIDKSGVCCLNTATRQVEVSTLNFPDLLDYLAEYEHKAGVVVVVEAGWKNAITNYHTGTYGRVAQKVALSVGRNQQVGHCIVQMCKHWGIEVVEKAPLRKMWRGKDRKITQEELLDYLSKNGYKHSITRLNQEGRDACLLSIMF